MSRQATSLSPYLPSLLLVGLLAIAACGAESRTESAASPDSAREAVERGVPERRQPVESTVENPFENFDLPDDGEADRPIVRHELRIENGLTVRLVVAATAGAAPVVLDSLDPGESVRLDLEAPADMLQLQWHTIDGNISGFRPIVELADSIQVVRIDAESSDR
jgi:hypothetical protein